MEKTISARVNLNPYVNRVLGMIKIKYDLKDKSEAINKFIEIYGDEILEKESTEEYLKKVISISDNHFNKYSNKKMSLEELDSLCEL
jgi:hypothetical protein